MIFILGFHSKELAPSFSSRNSLINPDTKAKINNKSGGGSWSVQHVKLTDMRIVGRGGASYG